MSKALNRAVIVEHSWLPRVPPPYAAVHPAVHRRRELCPREHQRPARADGQEDEDAWEFITLFERRKRPNSDIYTYHFVGYVSVYPFWSYPDQVRLRLSQFVILPPYQEQGHGCEYPATVRYFADDSQTILDVVRTRPEPARCRRAHCRGPGGGVRRPSRQERSALPSLARCSRGPAAPRGCRQRYSRTKSKVGERTEGQTQNRSSESQNTRRHR